jgi:hypothetical protein
MGTDLKKTGRGMSWGAGVLAFMAVQAACAQTPAASGPVAQDLLSSPGLAPVQSLAQEKILREIDDLQNGNRWLLVRNGKLPGGPGRLVQVAAYRKKSGGAALQIADQPGNAALQPVIRAGDRLIIEEHTARVDAVLEACALNQAAPGSVFNARLAIGGKVVQAVALGPGRAALQAEAGVRP